ncbi:MAG TPA: Verru_Chthon cassette protein A, partial [Chthoniobacteraceae bacterium]|nr:Verru_Chthon cassette protein A [Chthoniobacteraceae bacterium]
MKRKNLLTCQHGFAVIIALMLIALIAVVVVAFFSSIRTEVRSGTASAAGQSARQFANMALQLVQSQIQNATTQSGGPSSQMPAVTWASQPGLIRCYDNTGAETEWYKLYSAATMVVPSPSNTNNQLFSGQAGDLPLSPWATPGTANYGIYTDMNSPVISESGSLCWPIMAPPDAYASGTTVPGFYVDSTKEVGYVSGTESATDNSAAMPVRWLYVLQSGTMVPAVATGSSGVVSVPGASGSNPIVGRVAFWTDDESCKLNVNTAADGTYFDSPRFDGPTPSSSPNPASISSLFGEEQMAITPPVGGEYQRYIGHPAQTKIGFVLPSLSSTNLTIVDRSHIESLISPFMQWGGSAGGTQTIWNIIGNSSYALATPLRRTPYASVDEWLMSTNVNGAYRVENAALTGYSLFNSSEAINKTAGTIAQRNQLMNQLHFFLTANSQAPEVNLFGQPRIAIWPNDYRTAAANLNGTTTPYATTFDQMIAGAATLDPVTTGTNLYYFQRFDSTSTTNDFASTMPDMSRNRALFQYLRTLAGSPIPGYGPATFDSKYSNSEMDQILTEIFDYIRSTDTNDPMLSGSLGGVGLQQYAPGRPEWYYSDANGSTLAYPGTGQVTPIIISGTSLGASYSTKGFGRFDSISEITMDFTRSQQAYVTGSNNTISADPNNTYVVGLLYLGLYSPSLGPGKMYPDIRIEVDPVNGAGGLGAMTVTTGGSTYNVFASLATSGTGNTAYSVIPKFSDWHNAYSFPFFWGGVAGPRQLTVLKNATAMYTLSSGSVPMLSGTAAIAGPVTEKTLSDNYKFCGIPIEMKVNGTFTFSGGPLDIKISYSGLPKTAVDPRDYEGQSGSPSNVVQDIVVNFPGFTSLPVPWVPTLPGSALVTSGTVPFTTLSNRLDLGYYGRSDSGPDNMPIMNGDVARSLVVGYNGDLRMVAGQASIPEGDTTNPESPFTEIGGDSLYKGSTAMLQSNRDVFKDDRGKAPYDFTTYGFSPPGGTGSNGQFLTLVSGGYADSVTGFLDSSATTPSPTVTGDWDNGISFFPDGPYINKPDETSLQYYYFNTWAGAGMNDIPYFTGGDSGGEPTAVTYSSPNRTVASPVEFGSLSTGVPVNGSAAVPWRTLLFRPQQKHFGGPA